MRIRRMLRGVEVDVLCGNTAPFLKRRVAETIRTGFTEMAAHGIVEKGRAANVEWSVSGGADQIRVSWEAVVPVTRGWPLGELEIYCQVGVLPYHHLRGVYLIGKQVLKPDPHVPLPV